MSKFIIEQVEHALGTFFRVLNDGMVVMQADTKAECLQYIQKNVSEIQNIELSKATIRLLNKLNMNATIIELDNDDYYTAEHNAEMIIHLDNEADHEGDAIYKLYTTEKGFKAVLWDVWSKDDMHLFPKLINSENELKRAFKAMSKEVI